MICLMVCHSSEPCKTAEVIKMPFGLTTHVDSSNHLLDWSPHPLMGRGNFEGEGQPIVKYRDTLW